MKCPECGYEDSKVIDSRPAENKIRRRRECLSCKCRFTTYEMVETIPLMVVKKDNTIEPFDRDKLINRLARATVKRPVQIEDLEKMVEDIVQELKNQFRRVLFRSFCALSFECLSIISRFSSFVNIFFILILHKWF